MSDIVSTHAEIPHHGDAAGASHGTGSFEDVLVSNLQPVRGFALAWAIKHLFDSGLYECLSASGRTIASLAAQLRADPVKVRGLLLFLQVEGFTELQGEEARLTAAGKTLSACEPWYRLLLGGYGGVFAALGPALARDALPLPRDWAQVGRGSCGISRFDAIPLTRELLRALTVPPRKIVDLGCGNALYLAELAGLFPNLVAVGAEPSAGGYREAMALIGSSRLDARVELLNCSAQEFVARGLHPDADVLLLGFVLHEILGLEGEAGLEAFLVAVAAKYRGRHLVVIEVEDRIEDLGRMRHGLARAYYNPYYLLHFFTGQRLEKRAFWDALFRRLSFELIREGSPHPGVDSTEFEFGLLLRMP